mgnify:CR=1 FL=1
MKVVISGLILAFWVNFSFGQTLARQTLASAGSSSSSEGFQVNATIGQPSLVNSSSEDSTYVGQGFQRYIVRTGISKLFNLSYELYPNPTTDYFTLTIDGITDFTVHLTDVAGKQISVRKTNANKYDIQELSSGAYFISVIHKDRIIPISTLIILK